MKSKKTLQEPVTAPLLKDLTDGRKASFKKQLSEPSVGSKPLEQPDLFQDPGNAYNPDFTFPQD
jgi:hypothetical protein